MEMEFVNKIRGIAQNYLLNISLYYPTVGCVGRIRATVTRDCPEDILMRLEDLAIKYYVESKGHGVITTSVLCESLSKEVENG